ncbi:putative MFS family arabinose efflux permease [Azospirillum fermentarium]|uniref:YbfB/YjiJ family MFS transporter n=1 Tax=Azospirillum fermentarium TaxID=1233114 RepID=UPI00222688E5|nr:YbfB/YjiJ family MFS transporter [Azospirillum fermentarium]MCW2245465.1 putative MFS family arabinose efflux permease [Azospirillum fermentarium]
MVPVLAGGVAMLALAMGVGRFAYTPLLPAMQAATGLGGDGAGVLASLNYLGYFLGAVAVTRVPHGAVRGRVFRLSLAASVLSTAAMGLSDDRTVWAVLRLISGLASAGVFILGIAMVLDALTRAGRESLAAWIYTGIGAGIAGSGLFVGLAEPALGWNGCWLALGAIAGGLAILPWRAVRDHTADAAPVPAPAAAVPAAGAAFSLPLILLTAAYFLEGGGYIVTGTFLVALLKQAPDTAGVGAVAWMVAGLAGMGSGLFWGWLGRRIGPWPALLAAHVAQAAGIVLPLLGGPAAGVLSAALFGGTFIGIVSLSFTLGRQLSAGSAGRVVGTLTAVYGLGQIIGPLPAGMAVAHTGSYTAALTGAAVAVLAAAVLLAAGWVLSRRRTLSPATETVPCRT